MPFSLIVFLSSIFLLDHILARQRIHLTLGLPKGLEARRSPVPPYATCCVLTLSVFRWNFAFARRICACVPTVAVFTAASITIGTSCMISPPLWVASGFGASARVFATWRGGSDPVVCSLSTVAGSGGGGAMRLTVSSPPCREWAESCAAMWRRRIATLNIITALTAMLDAAFMVTNIVCAMEQGDRRLLRPTSFVSLMAFMLCIEVRGTGRAVAGRDATGPRNARKRLAGNRWLFARWACIRPRNLR